VPQRRDGHGTTPEQLALFAVPHPVVERLRGLDANNMTPMQALELLAKLIDDARAGQGNA
jgi:hypothetical protein